MGYRSRGAAATALAVENATYDIVDVRDPGGIARAVEATEARLGPPDILVNNAGISGPNRPLAEYRRKNGDGLSKST